MHIWENFKVSLFIFGSSPTCQWMSGDGSSKKVHRDGKLKGSWESKWKETRKKGLSQHKISEKVFFLKPLKLIMSSP